MAVSPELVLHAPGVRNGVLLVWRFSEPVACLSSAPVGGGPGTLHWLLYIGVALDYGRHDLAAHANELAGTLGLAGNGAALFTAADVSCWVAAEEAAVSVHATVGVSIPTWAADVDHAGPDPRGSAWHPGTINLVAQLPVVLQPAAAVNAVMTMTEAKAQALLEAGVPGTGTASDAVVVTWPESHGAEGAEPFAGPRSEWGARLARATHRAVFDGLKGWR